MSASCQGLKLLFRPERGIILRSDPIQSDPIRSDPNRSDPTDTYPIVHRISGFQVLTVPNWSVASFRYLALLQILTLEPVRLPQAPRGPCETNGARTQSSKRPFSSVLRSSGPGNETKCNQSITPAPPPPLCRCSTPGSHSATPADGGGNMTTINTSSLLINELSARMNTIIHTYVSGVHCIIIFYFIVSLSLFRRTRHIGVGSTVRAVLGLLSNGSRQTYTNSNTAPPV